jgi:hypothetical protein
LQYSLLSFLVYCSTISSTFLFNTPLSFLRHTLAAVILFLLQSSWLPLVFRWIHFNLASRFVSVISRHTWSYQSFIGWVGLSKSVTRATTAVAVCVCVRALPQPPPPLPRMLLTVVTNLWCAAHDQVVRGCNSSVEYKQLTGYEIAILHTSWWSADYM